MVKVSTTAKFDTQYFWHGGKKYSYWPDGSALVLIDLFCRGIPFEKHEEEFMKVYPGYDARGKFSTQRNINGHINKYLKAHPLTEKRAAELKAGRTAAKKVPGGAIERTQGHEHTLAWHEHISTASREIKGTPNGERHSLVAEMFEGNVDGSGKPQEVKDHLNELAKKRQHKKKVENKVKVEQLKMKAKKDKI
ncbi:hypothetical protein JCM3765_006558 [Sporobolomyces pararoseus]